MRTERDATHGDGGLTGRSGAADNDLARDPLSQHDGPAAAPDQAQVETATLAARSATPVPVLVTGAVLAALAWRWASRRRHRDRRGN